MAAMCGIAGLLRLASEAPVDPALLGRCMERSSHRGPDADGVWTDGTLGLAHRRLSIIDLSGGAQPMLSEDGALVVAFNGEIFNFPALRTELEAAGHRFRTKSDTEVLLHGYRAWGEGMPARLRGQFAFGLIDLKQRKLLAARDATGEKPFYYRHDPATGELAFASELKSLPWPEGERWEVDPSALAAYLVHQYVPGNGTPVRGALRLPPAHQLTWVDGRVFIKRYWSLDYGPKLNLTEGEAVEALGKALEEAVRSRLMSDVPLGCFLSGGLDSTAVALCMAKMAGASRPKTFAIGFSEEEFNEAPHARRVADLLGTEHYEEIVTPDLALRAPLMAWHFDDLMGDPSALPQYELAILARKHVTVALTGDGGDESLAGYTRYLGLPRWQAWRRRLGPLGAALVARGARLGARVLPGAAAIQASRAAWTASSIGAGEDSLYIGAMTLCWPDLAVNLIHPDLRGQVAADATEHAGRAAMDMGGAREALDRRLASDVHTYLPGDLLVKVDRMTMARSLEARAPFLDQDLMELCARLPAEQKMPGGRLKAILKDWLRPHIPAELIDRKKQGFGVPLDAWFRGPLRPWVRDILLDTRTRRRGLLNAPAVEALLAAHDRYGGHGHRLWLLVLLELWCRTFLDADGSAPQG